MSDRVPVQCQQCGQTDDHPKVHVGELGTGQVVSKHNDCLSVSEKRSLFDSAQEEGSGPKASAVIKACEDGARGDDLLKLIQDPKKLPQAEGLHNQRTEG